MTRQIMLSLTVILLAVSVSIAAGFERIDNDLAAGLIDDGLAKIYRAAAVVNPELIPPQYRFDEPAIGKCATDLMQEALLAMIEDDELYDSFYEQFAIRPVTDTVYVSPQGFFRMHYDTVDIHAVPADDTNSNGVPDYVERGGIYADSVWNYIINTLGFFAPPSDGTQGGGVDQYDIYFQHLPYYGYTDPELVGPEPWNDYTSHIVVHATFSPGFPPNDDPEGDQIGALKVTIAHEFFHAVQFAYNAGAESYFMEMSSVWMEDMAFPVVNDNYNFLPYFYDSPEDGLMHDGMHRYASFVWVSFLEEKLGTAVVRDLWTECRYNSATGSWSYVLDTMGTSLGTEFTDFLNWNYFTDARADDQHFDDGADYPQIQIMTAHTDLPDSGNTSLAPPEPLSSNYIDVYNYNGYKGILTFNFAGMPTATWGVAVVVDRGSGELQDTLHNTISNGQVKVYIPYFEDVLRVTFIPGVTSTYGSLYTYSYDLYLRPHGDADCNEIVEIADAVYVIEYIFNHGPASNPYGSADADCNGIVEITDAVYLIAYIFGYGPAPCEQE